MKNKRAFKSFPRICFVHFFQVYFYLGHFAYHCSLPWFINADAFWSNRAKCHIYYQPKLSQFSFCFENIVVSTAKICPWRLANVEKHTINMNGANLFHKYVIREQFTIFAANALFPYLRQQKLCSHSCTKKSNKMEANV